jgi:ribosome-associated protein
MNIPEITQIAINALENIKGENIVVLDTSHQSALFNIIIICSGNSPRQVSALANSVSEDFRANNIEIIGIEGKRGGEWVLVDGGDVVIHIMLPQVRAYYDLETLWNE